MELRGQWRSQMEMGSEEMGNEEKRLLKVIGLAHDSEIGDEADDLVEGIVAEVRGIEAVSVAGGKCDEISGRIFRERNVCPSPRVDLCFVEGVDDDLVKFAFLIHTIVKRVGGAFVHEAAGAGIDRIAKNEIGLERGDVLARLHGHFPARDVSGGKLDGGEGDALVRDDVGNQGVDGKDAGRNFLGVRSHFRAGERIAGDDFPGGDGEAGEFSVAKNKIGVSLPLDEFLALRQKRAV
jgi:hypothetical protein